MAAGDGNGKGPGAPTTGNAGNGRGARGGSAARSGAGGRPAASVHGSGTLGNGGGRGMMSRSSLKSARAADMKPRTGMLKAKRTGSRRAK